MESDLQSGKILFMDVMTLSESSYGRGMSGPAILKLSAWGAIDLYHLNYHLNEWFKR